MSLSLWDANTAAVAWLQSLLQQQGYYSGAIDGIYGPVTAQAVAAAQTAMGLPATGQDDDTFEARLSGGTPAAASPTNSADIIRAQYGNVAWAYNVPELKPIFDQAVAERWDEARIVGAISATTWWKTTAASARTWAETKANDPATAQAQLNAGIAKLSDQASTMGLTIDQTKLAALAEQAISLGLDANQVTDLLMAQQSGPIMPGTVSALTDQLKNTAAQYAVPVSDATLNQWANQIATGAATLDGFNSYTQAQAKSMFPGLAAAIDSGITVKQYVEPYVQTAAQELGINPNSISLTDPKWQRAITNVDPKTGQPAAMSLYDWTKTLRTDAMYGWDQTQGAQAAATQLANGLAKTLGYAA